MLDLSYAELQTERRKLLSVIVGCAIAILMELAFPALAIVFCFGIGVYLIVPCVKLCNFSSDVHHRVIRAS